MIQPILADLLPDLLAINAPSELHKDKQVKFDAIKRMAVAIIGRATVPVFAWRRRGRIIINLTPPESCIQVDMLPVYFEVFWERKWRSGTREVRETARDLFRALHRGQAAPARRGGESDRAEVPFVTVELGTEAPVGNAAVGFWREEERGDNILARPRRRQEKLARLATHVHEHRECDADELFLMRGLLGLFKRQRRWPGDAHLGLILGRREHPDGPSYFERKSLERHDESSLGETLGLTGSCEKREMGAGLL